MAGGQYYTFATANMTHEMGPSQGLLERFGIRDSWGRIRTNRLSGSGAGVPNDDRRFPVDCPYRLERILDEDWFPVGEEV